MIPTSTPEPLVIDGDFFLTNLNSTLFPWLSSSIEVHNGFGDAQAYTATDVLAAVQTAMSTHRTTAVTMVGHSIRQYMSVLALHPHIGAAITLLDSVYLPLWLSAGTTFQTICYGLPRVGNQAFANYVDANLHLTHINNEEDPIPICPGMFLGFVHPPVKYTSGTLASGQLALVSISVPEIWDGDLSDHDGPYNGVEMGC
ncbi:hypothetical protein PAXINDRAFT_6912 [Paxillus involutus ATCC 200175]|nr:hypothetical protein PAXINDRAFT_6912 [Paxillus involutus ATCC 200175]